MRAFHLASLAVLLLACTAQTAHARNTQDRAAQPTDGIVIHDSSGHAITPIYHDVDGKRIDGKAFNKALAEGLRFRMTPTPSGRYVVLTLLKSNGKQRGLSLKPAPPAIKAGQSLPTFHLSTVHGHRISNADLAGQPTLVDFFFAACVACIEELPAMNAYRKQHPDMHFLAITFDQGTEARRFVDKRHFEWPVAYDGKALIKEIGLTGYPTLMLLDADGHLLASRTGGIPSGNANPSDATAIRQSQLQWLDHWVTKNSQ